MSQYRVPEPCLCGAPDCPRCNPAGYAYEQDMNWVEKYFPGDRCKTCQYCKDDITCAVLEGDDGPCPALEAEHARAAEEYYSSTKEYDE